MPIALQARQLTKRYGDFTALDAVTLTVQTGDVYGLVGRNGAGKTTFFKCLLGLAKPSGGTIAIGPGGDLNAARAGIGFMINPSFFGYLSAADNLEYVRRARGIGSRAEVPGLLKLVGLDGVKQPFKAFSMGMKQRLGIAAALLGSPDVVVLDEPINGLDPQGIMEMRDVIRDANQKMGATVVVSSHILSELDLVATRFGFIERGKLVQEITHDDLHEHTQASLVIEVDDVARARSVVAAMGLTDLSSDEHRMTIKSPVERPAALTRALVEAGVGVSDLHRQSVTLEEYFVQLVGGAK